MTDTTLPGGTTLPAATLRILNSPTLIMGRTHAGKSSLLVTAAEYVWETYGKVTCWYLSDGGGLPFQVQSLVNLGIVWLWRMRSRSAQGLAHETCQRAAEGYWPREIDPLTGEAAPNVELVAPMTTRIAMKCPNGHVVKVVALEAQLRSAAQCPTCKMQVTLQNMTTEKTVTPTKGFEKVGARFYDGISSMMSWGMDDLSDRTGRQELTGEKSALGGVVHSGDVSFSGSNRAQFGFMQKRAETLVLASGGIQGMVIPPIWTALVQDGSDEAGLRIAGPQIIGQARTAEAPQWFGDTIEAIIVNTADEKRYRRMNLKSYVDKDGMRHLCGVRSYPGLLPDFLEDEDTGEANAPSFQNFSMGTFYRLRQQAREKTESLYREKYQDAPGLVAGTMTFGEPKGEAPAAAATLATPTAPRPAPAKPKPAPVAAKPAAGTTPSSPAPSPAAPSTTPASTPPAGAPPAASPAKPLPAPPRPVGAAPVKPVSAPLSGAAAVAAPTASATAAPTGPSAAATGPVTSPPVPKPPARGPSAAPPGRRPTPAAIARPSGAPIAKPW